MKNYSLIKIVNDPAQQESVSWRSFEQVMKEQEIKEVIIFAVGAELTSVNLCKRMIINKAIIEPDNVGCWDEYCIVDHNDDDRIVPCLVLLDPEIEYAVIKAIEFQPNDYFIQCRIMEGDNRFVVNKCELEFRDPEMYLLMN